MTAVIRAAWMMGLVMIVGCAEPEKSVHYTGPSLNCSTATYGYHGNFKLKHAGSCTGTETFRRER